MRQHRATRMKPFSYFADLCIHGTLSATTGRISPSALALLMCSTRRARARIPNARKIRDPNLRKNQRPNHEKIRATVICDPGCGPRRQAPDAWVDTRAAEVQACMLLGK